MREMRQPVVLICGVPGSGKTWVCEKLLLVFNYVPHDMHYNNHLSVLAHESDIGLRPIVTECPFGERILREGLEKKGIKVIPYFVVEDPFTVRRRYEAREKKKIPKGFLTRAVSIKGRAIEWDAPFGKSAEILNEILKDHAKGII